MKAKEMRELTADELRHKESEVRKELFNLKIQNSIGQLTNFARIRILRRDVARIKTILKGK